MANDDWHARRLTEMAVLGCGLVLLLSSFSPVRLTAQSLGACSRADVAAGALIRAGSLGTGVSLPAEPAHVVSHGVSAFRLPQIEATLIHVWDSGTHLPGYLLVARGAACFQLGGFAFPELSALAASMEPVQGGQDTKLRACMLALVLAPQLVQHWSVPAEGIVPSEEILSHCTVDSISRTAVRGHDLQLVSVRQEGRQGHATQLVIAFDSGGKYVTSAPHRRLTTSSPD